MSYSHSLKYEERDNKVINQFRMTRNEKKLNYFDLQVNLFFSPKNQKKY